MTTGRSTSLIQSEKLFQDQDLSKNAESRPIYSPGKSPLRE